MRLLKNPNIDFLARKNLFLGLSLLVSLVGAVYLVVRGGPNWGIDFTGGAQIIYQFAQKPDEDAIRKIVEAANVPVSSVQRYDRPDRNQVLLRVPLQAKEGRDVSGEMTAALARAMAPAGEGAPARFDLNLNGVETLRAKLVEADPERLRERPNADPATAYAKIAEEIIRARSKAGLFASVDAAAATEGLSPAVSQWLKANAVTAPFTLLSGENVGPQVGRDLRRRGSIAVVLSWAAMLGYIAFRFKSWSFGAGAVVALIHDTWVTLTICAFFDVEISLTVVAAFLTLIGYSVNDTVVIFDRVRENLSKKRKEPLAELFNRSVNETLARTFLTSGLTFLSVLSLFVFGGEALRGFSFVMVIGIIVGTYSTIFIAAPVVIWWEGLRSRRASAAPAGAATPPAGAKPAKAGR